MMAVIVPFYWASRCCKGARTKLTLGVSCFVSLGRGHFGPLWCLRSPPAFLAAGPVEEQGDQRHKLWYIVFYFPGNYKVLGCRHTRARFWWRWRQARWRCQLCSSSRASCQRRGRTLPGWSNFRWSWRWARCAHLGSFLYTLSLRAGHHPGAAASGGAGAGQGAHSQSLHHKP